MHCHILYILFDILRALGVQNIDAFYFIIFSHVTFFVLFIALLYVFCTSFVYFFTLQLLSSCYILYVLSLNIHSLSVVFITLQHLLKHYLIYSTNIFLYHTCLSTFTKTSILILQIQI